MMFDQFNIAVFVATFKVFLNKIMNFKQLCVHRHIHVTIFLPLSKRRSIISENSTCFRVNIIVLF